MSKTKEKKEEIKVEVTNNYNHLAIALFLGLIVIGGVIWFSPNNGAQQTDLLVIEEHVVIEQELKYWEITRLTDVGDASEWLCTNGIKVQDLRHADGGHLWFDGHGQCAILYETEVKRTQEINGFEFEKTIEIGY